MKFYIFLFLLLTPASIFAQSNKSSPDASKYEAICNVVGNKNSKIYHVQGGAHYAKMLEKNAGKDNRACFSNEQEAMDSGYRKSKR